MRYYEASSTIDAPAAAVWEVLTDGDELTEWDSGIERFEGRIASGEKVTLYSEVSPGRAFPLTVAEFDPPRRMVWRGGMPLGLFTGERTYSLRAVDGGTQFTMREEFTGLMAPVIWRSMPDLGPSFTKFAAGLKARVESGEGT